MINYWVLELIDGFCQHKDKNGIKCPDLKCESLTYNFDIFLEHTSKLLSHDEILSLYNEVGEFSIKSENEQYDILIIEDDLATIRLLTSYFERERYICKSVRNGVESLKQLEISQPKVILLDLTLPDMDWYDVALQIKADPSIRDIPLFLFIFRAKDPPTPITHSGEPSSLRSITIPLNSGESSSLA